MSFHSTSSVWKPVTRELHMGQLKVLAQCFLKHASHAVKCKQGSTTQFLGVCKLVGTMPAASEQPFGTEHSIHAQKFLAVESKHHQAATIHGK
jgi:hypothetical protein